jgi:hypothetical protein
VTNQPEGSKNGKAKIKDSPKMTGIGIGVGMGIAIGAPIGAATDNAGL